MELRWITSLSSSALHAAEQLLTRKALVDRAMQLAIQKHAESLQSELHAQGLEVERAFEYLPALAAEIPNNRQLVDVMMRKVRGLDTPSPVLEALAGRLADLEQAVAAHSPTMMDELELRSKPLRQQWEARGPGMLSRLQDLIGRDAFVARAAVILVPPVTGGGGTAHPQHNCVRIEAVLANPHQDIPEAARLGWLLTQLHWDLPMFSEEIAPARRGQTIALAALPPALSGAHHVEWTGSPQEVMAAALHAWMPLLTDIDETAAILSNWWNTYLDAPTSWPVALMALDRMLL